MSPIAPSVYPSLRRFYAGDPRRRRSPERDVGLYWRDEHGASYRAAWVRETGELYVVAHGDPAERGGRVLVLARMSRGRLDHRLAGWKDVCGLPGSLTWLLDRSGGRAAVAA